jgi:predicted nucleic acid-binding Zn ribbon protein
MEGKKMKFVRIPFEDFEKMALSTNNLKYVRHCKLCGKAFASTDQRKMFCIAKCANTAAKRMERSKNKVILCK